MPRQRFRLASQAVCFHLRFLFQLRFGLHPTQVGQRRAGNEASKLDDLSAPQNQQCSLATGPTSSACVETKLEAVQDGFLRSIHRALRAVAPTQGPVARPSRDIPGTGPRVENTRARGRMLGPLSAYAEGPKLPSGYTCEDVPAHVAVYGKVALFYGRAEWRDEHSDKRGTQVSGARLR